MDDPIAACGCVAAPGNRPELLRSSETDRLESKGRSDPPDVSAYIDLGILPATQPGQGSLVGHRTVTGFPVREAPVGCFPDDASLMWPCLGRNRGGRVGADVIGTSEGGGRLRWLRQGGSPDPGLDLVFAPRAYRNRVHGVQAAPGGLAGVSGNGDHVADAVEGGSQHVHAIPGANVHLDLDHPGR